MRNSNSYITTFMATDPVRDLMVQSVKRIAKLANAKLRVKDIESPKFVEYSWSGKCQLKYRWVVRVRGRLGKDNPHAALYRRGGSLHRYSSQDIRPEHAAHFDIYMHKRTNIVPVSE